VEALQILKTFVLAELVRIQEECLSYHCGSTAKDIVLLEAQKLVFIFLFNSDDPPLVIQGYRVSTTQGNRLTLGGIKGHYRELELFTGTAAEIRNSKDTMYCVTTAGSEQCGT
jgi:hypothetical protein